MRCSESCHRAPPHPSPERAADSAQGQSRVLRSFSEEGSRNEASPGWHYMIGKQTHNWLALQDHQLRLQ